MVERKTDNFEVGGSIPPFDTKTQEKKEIQVRALSRPLWASSSKWLKHRAQLKGLLLGSSYPTVDHKVEYIEPQQTKLVEKILTRQPIAVNSI